MKQAFLSFTLALALLTLAASALYADIVRFRYMPSPAGEHTSLRVNPDGAMGQWRPGLLSLRSSSWYCEPPATHIVTYIHPATGQQVSVPIAFPEGTPRISYRTNAVMYSYTLYTIRVEFLPDGAVDVVYNSGLLRPVF